MFSGCTVPPDSTENELGSSDQRASPSAGKSAGVVLVPCSRMEVCPYSYFWGIRATFVTTDEFSVRVRKLLKGLESHELTAYLSIFNLFWLNELWPYYQKEVNQITLNRINLKLSGTNIRGLHSNFDCESFLESNSPDIHALWEINLDDSIDSGNFSVKGYLLFMWRKDFLLHGTYF